MMQVEDTIKIDLKKAGHEDMDWTQLASDKFQ